jgi:flagellin
MVINTNISAQTAASNLQTSQAMLSKSLSRLSSGSKITSPSDDAAGLAVAMRLDAQVKRLEAAKSNVGNAISFTQTQDGYLKKIAKALDRMSELTILAQDVTKSDADRVLYNGEFVQLSLYFTSASNKDFNGVTLFSASP